MVKNLTILFFIRKDKVDTRGYAPVYCRITCNGKRTEVAIKLTVPIDKWKPKLESIIGNNDEARLVKAFIQSVKLSILDKIRLLEQKNEEVTGPAIKNLFIGIKESPKSILELFLDHNDKLESLVGKEYAKGTYKRFETCFQHVQNYIKHQYKQNDLVIEKVDYSFILNLDYYLRSKANCANNTTFKYLRNFKKITKLALSLGYLKSDPFLSYKVKLEKVDRGYLIAEELKALEDAEFGNNRLEMVRDAFLFQCYTGLSYIDLFKLGPQNVITGVDGNLWISTVRTKTGMVVKVPLLSKATRLIEKYQTSPECLRKGTLIPMSSNQRMNSYLKEIADLTGVQKRLSTHLARHTFATTVTLAKGVSIEAVSKMLGHSNLLTTMTYARMLDKRVGDEMALLNVNQ